MTATAAGEVLGALVESVGAPVQLAVLAATPGHAGALDDVAGVVEALLEPAVVIGVVTDAVTAGADEWPGRPALACLAVQSDGAVAVGDGGAVGLSVASGGSGVATDEGEVAVAVRGPLLWGGRVRHDPMQLRFGPRSGVDVVVAAGDRRIGPPCRVTDAAGSMVRALDGRPAHDVLQEVLADRVPLADRQLASAGLRLAPHGGGTPVVVAGVDRSDGALAVAAPLTEGSTVSFSVRDPDVAVSELLDALDGATAAVAFTQPTERLGGLLPDIGHFPPLLGVAGSVVLDRRLGPVTVALVVRASGHGRGAG